MLFFFKSRYHCNLFHKIQNFKPMYNFSKDCVLSIEMGVLCIADEKLAPICVGSTVCHGNHSPRVVLCDFMYQFSWLRTTKTPSNSTQYLYHKPNKLLPFSTYITHLQHASNARVNKIAKYLQRISNFIIKLLFPYAGSTLSCSCRIPTLDHETLYIPVEYSSIIVTTCAEC